jgi:ABC-type transport system substrate-binding protein
VNDSTPATFEGTYHDWWWEGPHGETLEIEFWASLESGIARAYGDLIAENLRDMHVKCESRIESFNFWLPFLANHSLPAPVFLGNSLTTDPDWMEWSFHSDYATVPYSNYAGIQNDTVDDLIEQMMAAVTPEEAEPIVDELQEILWYECPYVLCYMNKILSFARTEDWEGHVNEAGIGTFDYWGRVKTRPIAGGAEDPDGDGFGGTLRINLPTDIDTRNYMITTSGYTDDILETVYIPLVTQDAYDPSIDVPSLAYDWNVTVDDPANETTIVFNLFENVTWHDGTPFTAHDVNFSIYYLRDLSGHNWIDAYPDVASVDIIDNYTVQVNCDTDSFFVFHNVAFGLILPKHIWENYPTVANFTGYDPEWPVGCGPFNFTEWVPGEYVRLDYNPDYHLLPPGRTAPVVPPPLIDPILLVAVVAVVAVVVIVGGYFAMRRGKA